MSSPKMSRLDYDTVDAKFGTDIADLHQASVAELASSSTNEDLEGILSGDPEAVARRDNIEDMAFFDMLQKLQAGDDVPAALAHAGQVKGTPEVMALLTSIGAKKLLDGCGAGLCQYTPLVPFFK